MELMDCSNPAAGMYGRNFLVRVLIVVSEAQRRFVHKTSLEQKLQVNVVDRLLISDVKRTDITPEAFTCHS